MDWSEERYVRVYTRDTPDLLAFGFEGRAVWWELIRKVDRAGVLDHGGDLDIVAELLRLPVDFFRTGLARIVKRGSAKLTETAIIVPNLIEAQEAEQSDKMRQRESRARRRERALAAGLSPDEAKAVARPDKYGVPDVTNRDPMGSQNVTEGHAGSHGVTQGHSVLSRAVPDCAVPEPLPSPPKGGGAGGRAKGPGRASPETRAVVEAFNACFERRLSPEPWEQAVSKVLARGYTEAQIRGVVWWAAEEWGADPVRRASLTPLTLLKFTSSQGYRTFPQYLDCAGERWRESHGGEAPPWEKPADTPVLALVGGAP